MRRATCIPLIGSDHAGCKCGRWAGLDRNNDEPQGQFTIRAYEAHKAHTETPQPDLFDLSDLTPIFEEARR